MAKDSKEHILEVSFMLFMQKGFKAVTMKEIVNKTGLSKGAFYHYFESKEQLFEEVMKHFYADIFKLNFDSFSHASLKEFIRDYLEDVNKKFLSIKKMPLFEEIGNLNHFLLIFDAFSILPNFKEWHRKDEEEEVRGWKRIFCIARKNGEIKSGLSDERLAKMTMFFGDGFGMHVIVENDQDKFPHFKKELQKLFDDFYTLIKA